ncbi:lantibiotic dehydratase [Mucilaginibacter sp. 44-25]|uniref:lantibiotic dehydratase n=1 Tax=Mucilaginibacter sp. 44-25 TaxID=1895794 RepID=UPI0009613455|nr:lantibiotic dehydratase [Mucilaginibacter sp. 44-25]OJW16876.1 MAG: hypothetical protein BGO48_10495 [Mucilaginibacter sp. 44-25]
MDVKLHNKAICRTPVFTINDIFHDKWNELKNLIAEASPEFYNLIKDIEISKIDSLPERVQITIWKYFNRAKYRATPFGGFASVSLLQTSNTDFHSIQLSKTPQTLLLPDWRKIIEHSDLRTSIGQATFFQANSTLYRFGGQIRYIRSINGKCQLTSIEDNEMITTVINYCKVQIKADILVKLLIQQFEQDDETITELLEQLLTLEVIFTDLRANITGLDYFERLNLKTAIENSTYRIDYRPTIHGQLSSTDFKDIQTYLQFWGKVQSQPQPLSLTKFAAAFRAKFGDDVVPLAYALDPEIGVGYGCLEEQATASEPFSIPLRQLVSDDNQRNSFELVNKSLYSFLMNALTEKEVIRLENFKMPVELTNDVFPNTFSVILSFLEKTPVIESAGGCTANALIGRFTVSNPCLEELGKEIASIEQSSNTNVLFFEIAYSNEKDVDNINRRLNSYSHEMPILTWSESSEPIMLSDIHITVQSNEVILWSKLHQKRMMPRLSSAYNFNRSNLALFRFLCDLQYQNLTTQLSFKLNEILPGCNYYPRVYYKSVITSPAMWSLPDYLTSRKGNIEDNLHKLNKWMSANRVSRYFKFGFQDQQLLVDSKNETDIKMFLSLAASKKGNNITISETSIGSQCITDEFGNDFNAQLILTYYHTKNIFKTPSTFSLLASQIGDYQNKGYFMPGSNWLYFEIYCHPIRSDQILMHDLAILFEDFQQLVEKWFFVRYNKPSHHIRLRIKLNEKENFGIMISRFEQIMREPLEKMTVSDIQIKTYFQELNRYGFADINLIETIFHIDSQYVLKLLRSNFSIEQQYAKTIYFMSKVLECYYADHEDRIHFARRVADGFAKELNLDKSKFKVINANFKAIKNSLMIEHESTELELIEITNLINDAISSLSEIQSDKLLVDLIHMHINRLFTDQQRTHEAYIYQLLVNYLRMNAALLKVLPELK